MAAIESDIDFLISRIHFLKHLSPIRRYLLELPDSKFPGDIFKFS